MTESKSSLAGMCIESAQRVCGLMDYFRTRQAEFWYAIDEMRANMPENALDETCQQWPLHYWMAKVLDEVQKYDNRGTAQVHKEPRDVFAAIHEMRQELEFPFLAKRSYRPSQSIDQLKAEGVSDAQICREWGFYDKDGRLEMDKYEKELQKPGSVINNDWKHPRQMEFERKKREMRREYESLLSDLTGRGRDPFAEQMVKCPETPEELYLQGVEVWQAAKMLGETEEAVAEMYREFSETLGSPATEPATTRTGQPIKDYQPIAPVPKKERDEVYDADGELTAAKVKELTGWDRDEARTKYEGWTTEKIKDHCRNIGVSIKGRVSDETMIERILDYDQTHVEQSLLANQG